MPTLRELLAEKVKLEQEIHRAHQEASTVALATVRELVQEFGFTSQQVFPLKPLKKKPEARYLNEKTGATWSGRGKPPAWIAGKDRSEFAIKATVTSEGSLLAELAAAAARNGR